MTMRRAFLTLFLALALSVPALAGTLAHSPRLVPSPQGMLLGGYQTQSGSDGTFELFTLAPEGGTAPLGRFNGLLAGIAIGRYDGHLYALTRDGALASYDDDPVMAAFADARWNFLDLAWYDGGLTALGYANGALYLVRPDANNQTWREDSEIAAITPGVDTAILVPIDDTLHLLWTSRSKDLSTGAIRHRVRQNKQWRELPPLPLGETAAFTVFRQGDGLSLVALINPPLNMESKKTLVRKVWFDGEWSDDKSLDKETVARLLSTYEFAGTWSDSQAHWLVTGSDGLNFISPHAQTQSGDSQLQRSAQPGEIRLDSPASQEEMPWQQLTSLFFVLAILVLMVLYCRRSRMLSRIMPGRPPDLTSRAVALTIDWILVSIGLSAYHLAAGDMNIYNELLTFGEVNQMFWINLAALAVFTTACEAWHGQTPGKWLTGLRVRSVIGGPPSFMQIIIRNVARFIDMFPILFPGSVGVITAMFNPRRQRVGDVIGATIVRRHCPLSQRRFILASASPRRLELLQALGLTVDQLPSNIDEDSISGETPEETAGLLAQAKARAALEKLPNVGEIVVAADTMVVIDGDVLGKPKNAEEAKAMLRRLSGRSHSVMTGVSIWDSAAGQGLSDVETTEVEFRTLTDREIDDYVATGDPLDKAGAYGIQTGHLVKEVRGSLSNVAGLPMEMLQSMMKMIDS